jgi:hypothetical protein
MASAITEDVRDKLVLHANDGGHARLCLRAEEEVVWLTRTELAKLFQTTSANISHHIRAILRGGELRADSVVKEDMRTAADGKRYCTRLYNLDLILAVGYRIKSLPGTRLRQWATASLKDILISGLDLDADRIEESHGEQYVAGLLGCVDERYEFELRSVEMVGSDSQGMHILDKTQNTMVKKGGSNAS